MTLYLLHDKSIYFILTFNFIKFFTTKVQYMLKSYNYSLKKYLYLNILGLTLGFAFIFINKLILNYLYKNFLEAKRHKSIFIIILRSYIDFYYNKQSISKKLLIDKKLFYYNSSVQVSSFQHFYNKVIEFENYEYIENKIIFIQEYYKIKKFLNLCQVGAAGGRQLEYIANKFNFTNSIYSEIDNAQVQLAKKNYGNKFSYFNASAQEVDFILNSSLFNKNNININNCGAVGQCVNIFFSNASLQYCSPAMLESFFLTISQSKHKIVLILSEPIELDFLMREKNFLSRKARSFNYKYKFFSEKSGMTTIDSSITLQNKLRSDKYFKNIATYNLLASNTSLNRNLI